MSEWYSFQRLDKKFIRALQAELEGRAIFKITTKSYTIIANGNEVTLDVIACLRRPREDHPEMIAYVKWKLFDHRAKPCRPF